jgi:homoserine kinase
MAAALDIFLELEVEETGEFSLDPGGLDVPTGRDNLVVRAFEALHPADGIAFRLKKTIPLGRGLGLERGGDRRPGWSPPTTSTSWR